VCIVLHINDSKLSIMEFVNINPDGSLCVYLFTTDTRPNGLCDSHCISGETFFGLG
jgi:hypothetical protein